MLQVTEGMPLQPHTCTVCGGNPVDDSGEQQKAIWASGVDIDWGNSLYICWGCGELIADLMGRATRGGFDDMAEAYEALLEEHNELREKYEQQEVLVDKIREGGAAQKQLRSASQKASSQRKVTA